LGSRPGSAHAAASPGGNRVCINQLLVERALPVAVEAALAVEPQAGAAGFSIPSWLVEEVGGVPVFTAEDLVAVTPPTARATVAVPGVPEGAFVLHVEVDTADGLKVGGLRPLAKGAWVVMAPTADDDFKRNTFQLLRLAHPSGATRRPWTFGRPLHRPNTSPPVVRVVYVSRNKHNRAEAFPAETVRSVGRVWGVFVDGALKRASV